MTKESVCPMEVFTLWSYKNLTIKGTKNLSSLQGVSALWCVRIRGISLYFRMSANQTINTPVGCNGPSVIISVGGVHEKLMTSKIVNSS